MGRPGHVCERGGGRSRRSVRDEPGSALTNVRQFVSRSRGGVVGRAGASLGRRHLETGPSPGWRSRVARGFSLSPRQRNAGAAVRRLANAAAETTSFITRKERAVRSPARSRPALIVSKSVPGPPLPVQRLVSGLRFSAIGTRAVRRHGRHERRRCRTGRRNPITLRGKLFRG